MSRCINAPTETKRIVCEQLHRWDTDPRPFDKSVFLPKSTKDDEISSNGIASIASDPYHCMDLRCLCKHLKGEWRPCMHTCVLADDDRHLTKAYRKEYRTLSNEERQRLHGAFRTIKQSGEFDKLATLYSQYSQTGGAHSGPAFLPWHREFLKRLEFAIRLVDPELSLPYWDSTLDSVLHSPEDSALWTDELIGGTNENGTVEGDFANWKVPQGRRMLRREVGRHGSLMTKDDVDHIMSLDNVDDILAFTAPRKGCHLQTDYGAFEYAQGSAQVFVGGDMMDMATAANDPLFYLHLAFVDMLWEGWRQQKQTAPERENLYPPDMKSCSSSSHFASSFMRPFEPLRNIDGLSSMYTDYIYEYAPRPSCVDGPSCGSKYLFCDHSRLPARCVAQVKPGGNCSGFHRGEAVCYRGRCFKGVCIPDPLTFSVSRHSSLTSIQIVPLFENCYNEHECCSIWAAKGGCQTHNAYMSLWCKASCGICTPVFNIAVECADFHRKCKQWAKRGECNKNPLWMRENCRKSCNKCNIKRRQMCLNAKLPPPKTTPPVVRLKNCKSPGCYNEHFCCPLWRIQGQCTTNATYMWCFCRVSCGVCIPKDYLHGTCENYHRRCKEWASRGECTKRAWMLENCRQACGSCYTLSELETKCRDGGGKFAIGKNKTKPPPPPPSKMPLK